MHGPFESVCSSSLLTLILSFSFDRTIYSGHEAKMTVSKLGLVLKSPFVGSAEVANLIRAEKTLNLEANSLDNFGVKKLAVLLEKNDTVTEIDLSDNDIGDPGAKQLAVTLQKN